MLTRQSITNLSNGVSQQPDELRHPSFGGAQDNALDSPALGKLKRPPTVHVAKVAADPTGYRDSFVHTIRRDEKEVYRVVIVGETVKVFDAHTGAEYPVYADPSALAYLQGTDGFRALTLGDTTIIVNRGKVVKTRPDAAPAAKNEALVYVRQADFSTGYTVTLEGIAVTHTTVDATSAVARQQIATGVIAKALYDRLTADALLASAFTFELYGSTIYLARKDGRDFSVSVADGLADRGMRVVKGSVQTFDDLPYKAKDGFVVEIVGDEGSTKDNYWVVYDASETAGEAGVWRETIKPGAQYALEASTLPHRLVRSGWLKPEMVVGGTPAVPVVVDGGWEETEGGWTENPGPAVPPPPVDQTPWVPADGSPIITEPIRRTPIGPVSEDEDDELREHTDRRRRPMLASPTARRVEANFDVDAANLLPGTQVSVELRSRRVTTEGEEFVTVGRRTFDAGQTYPEQRIVGEKPFEDGEELELVMEYEVGYTPPPSRRATVVAKRRPAVPPSGPVNAPTEPIARPRPGIVEKVLTHRLVDFNGRRLRHPFGWNRLRVLTIKGHDVLYPEGTGFTLTVGGVVFTHTSPADEYAEDVATAFQAKVDAHASFTASMPQPGELLIGGADGKAPAVTVETTFSPETTAWVPGAGFTPGELVGKVLLNRTDGSEGWISANTATTVTVEGLMNGAQNVFARGDKVVVKGDDGTPYFTFEPCYWNRRDVGDVEVAPWPSFVGQKINDVFHMSGRLGFIHGESAVLSRQGDLFNFFRETATDLLPTDYIDVTNAHPLTSDFHTAVPWGGTMLLISEAGQYELSGAPMLTPTSVRLDLLSRFGNSSSVAPFPAGSRLFLARTRRPNGTQIIEFTHPPQESPKGDDLTALLPSYIQGKPVLLSGDGALGFLALLCDARRDVLYVYIYEDGADGSRQQGSWSRWILPPGSEIIHLDAVDGSLGLLVKRNDGVFMETISLSEALTWEV